MCIGVERVDHACVQHARPSILLSLPNTYPGRWVVAGVAGAAGAAVEKAEAAAAAARKRRARYCAIEATLATTSVMGIGRSVCSLHAVVPVCLVPQPRAQVAGDEVNRHLDDKRR